MTRPEAVRFLRAQPTMAFPDGRLIAVREGRAYVLAPDGWTPLGPARPQSATPLTRPEAVARCRSAGRDPRLLDEVPTPAH